jgi:predicted metal-binding membrane protein
MAGMAGTMGLGLAAFVPVWTLMNAAMMLPSVTATAALYAKAMQRNRCPGSVIRAATWTPGNACPRDPSESGTDRQQPLASNQMP